MLNKYLDIIKAYAAESSSLKTWALSIMGASILAMVSTSYIKPLGLKWRIIYLIFIPAWIASSLSIYSGVLISRRLMAAFAAELKNDKETLINIAIKVDDNYDLQLTAFNYSIIFYVVWLMLYMIWWTISKPENVHK